MRLERCILRFRIFFNKSENFVECCLMYIRDLLLLPRIVLRIPQVARLDMVGGGD
jgi:hypothetical protein